MGSVRLIRPNSVPTINRPLVVQLTKEVTLFGHMTLHGQWVGPMLRSAGHGPATTWFPQ
jgi:hypothetical protein